MHNLEHNFDHIQNYLNLWDDSADIWSENWVKQAHPLNDKLFSNHRENSESTTEIILQLQEIFEQMIDDVNTENRRSYCQVIFNYCELTQDWRSFGEWVKAEIALKVEEDAPWLYYYLGRYLEETGKLKDSIDYHLLGIKESGKVEDKMFLACNHLGAGISLQRYNKPDDAEYHLLQALDLFKQQNHLYLQAHTLVNLGSSYDRFDQSKQAIICYEDSADILRKIHNYFDLGRILYSLGIAHLHLNQLTEAKLVLLEAKQLCQDNNNLYFFALTLYGIGWLEYKQGNFKDAQKLLENSMTEFTKAKELGVFPLSFPESEGNLYILAAASYSKGSEVNFAAAEKYLNLAETAYNQLDYPEMKLLNVLANRGRLYEYSANWQEAIATFSALLKEGKRLNSPNTIQDAATHLVYIYYKKSASFSQWFKLLNQLGFLGLKSLIKRFILTPK